MAVLQNENYKTSIKDHLEGGMHELMLLARLLILPWPNEEQACAEIHDHISRAFHHFSEAEPKLESRLLLVDSQSEALVAMKKFMEDNLQEKQGVLADLKSQIAALKEAEKKSKGMLETAKLHLENTKEALRLAHSAVAKNRMAQKVSIRLMVLPGLGSFFGAGMAIGYQAALDSAEKLTAEAQQAVDLGTAEVAGYGNEIVTSSKKEIELQAEINATEQKIPEIQAQREDLMVLQREVTTQQAWIRKCLCLLDLLAGKIHAAVVMSSNVCLPKPFVDILEEIAEVVGGKEGVEFCADKGIRVPVLEIKKAVKSLRDRERDNMHIDV